MDVVLQNYGCAISIMIVVMIQMNQRTCVVNVTAQLDGNVVQANQTIVVFQNGCSVMEKTIAAITVTNYQKIVQYAIAKPISNVPTIVVYQSEFIFI